MTSEEKRAWVMALVATVACAVYVALILGRAGGGPLTAVPYVATMLWNIGASIVASIVLHIAVTVVSPEGAGQKDQRDREIHRFGEFIGQSFLALGGVVALALALAEASHFWIAHVLYLAFFLSAVLGALAKLAAYRRGFHPW
jgi:membrane-associated protease RseP (regulator of RpoE activity)